MEERYSKQKRKKNIGRTVLKWILSLTLIVVLAVAVLGVIYVTDPRRKLTGSWETGSDVTAEVSEHASTYIKAAAMGGQIDLSQYMNDISVSRILTFAPDGTYSISVDRDSYERATDIAYGQMADALKALVILRFEAAGRSADTEVIEKLMQDKVGMSLKDYLKDFGPDIMPGFSDMEAKYNLSGIYSADRQSILFDNERTAEYIVSSGLLAIDAGNTVQTDETGTAMNGSVMYTRAGKSPGSNEDKNATGSSGDADATVDNNMTDVSCCETEFPDLAEMPCSEIVTWDLMDPVRLLLDDMKAMSKVSAATSKNRMLENISVIIPGKDTRKIKSIHYEYANNRFVSVRDLALALKGTDAEYDVKISGTEISIVRGQAYGAVEGEGELFEVEETDWNAPVKEQAEEESDERSEAGSETGETEESLASGNQQNKGEDPDTEDDGNDVYEYVTESLKMNKLTVDGREVVYASLLGKNFAGNPDAYMSITDLAMILDVYMSVEEDGLHIDPQRDFEADIEALRDAGFYVEVRSALVGDATTGEVYASYCDDVPVSIASTTKIMNLLCVMDAITSGEISRTDKVRTSLKASLLSGTSDGIIPMKEGDVFTVEDLIYGMMLPSSNECALMLAEHIAGSETEYVGRMNKKAVEIGLSDETLFYNCHGLPIYSDNIVTTKLQNRMTASDMFTLVSYLLSVYPQVTDITSTKEYVLSSNDMTIKNLNPMLYDLPECIGIKTGTTNMAGASLVAAVRAQDAAGNEHIIVSIEYGAENAVARNTVSELMLRYGMSVLSGKNAGDSNFGGSGKLPSGADIPMTAEGLIRLLLTA